MSSNASSTHAYGIQRRIGPFCAQRSEVRSDGVAPTSLSHPLTWVPVNEKIVSLAASMATEYQKAHSGIDAIDYLIAATAPS
jgi:hypothetical protein